MKIGDKLYYVRTNKYRYVTVKTVGRKWFTVAELRGRFSINDLREDGGQCTSRGRCHPSKEVYENQVRLNNLWTAFRRLISYTYKPPCSEENILQAMQSLNLNLKD